MESEQTDQKEETNQTEQTDQKEEKEETNQKEETDQTELQKCNLENNNNINNKSIIKHLVISGGGSTGLSFYGILKESQQSGLWNIENIQSIYSTSVGSIFSIIVCLKYEWDIIDNFLIKRPWQNVFKFDLYSIIQAFDRQGIFSMKIMEDIFSPLLLGVDLDINITLKEFYEINKIDLHIFSTELNKFETVDFSHKTHPDWRIIDVVYCSCALPILFPPYMKEDKCYIDGGILTNYPIYYCLQSGAKPEEIFGIKKLNSNIKPYNKENSTFFDYLMIIFSNIFEKLLVIDNNIHNTIEHEIKVSDAAIVITDILSTASSLEKRQGLINRGIEIFKDSPFEHI